MKKLAKTAVDKYAPIKKVFAGGIASLTVYLAHRYLNLDLGSAETAEAVIPAIGLAVSWAVKDTRVREVLDVAEAVVEATERAA
jgi:hypothetical protein